VLDAQGDKVAESRHFPYGGERWSSGTLPMDYRFTGQRFEQPLGIYIMGARWYDPALGRWLSADTIVPEPMDPQAFNRYSFVVGNPLCVA
jgi:RHS repeat-associated protein